MSLFNKAVPLGERCVLELPLNYTKRDHDVLDKIFRIANNMKNNLISWYDRQLTEMTRTRAWRDNQKSLSNLYSEYADDVEDLEKVKQRIAKKKENAKKKKKIFHLSRKDENQLIYLQSRVKEFEEKRKNLYAIRNEMIHRYGFSKFDFEKQMNKYRKSYGTLVGVDVAQKIAYSVWDMFQAVLYGKGESISFSPFSKFLAIEGKKNGANITFNKDKMTVTLGMKSNKICMRVKKNRKDPYGYETEALSRRVCYCRIIRKAYPEGWRYFLQLVLEGPPPVKVKPETGEMLHSMSTGRVGQHRTSDLGVQRQQRSRTGRTGGGSAARPG